MVDTLDSKPSAERRESSSLSLATKICSCGGMVDTVRLERIPERGVGSSPTMSTICIFNSVGSECHPYKVEVVGSNPTRCTKR